MPMIAGVGDEVVLVAEVVLVLVVAAVAWWSTNASPDRYRTVLVMRPRHHHPATVRIETNLRPTVGSPAQTDSDVQASEPIEIPNEPVETPQPSRLIPLQEMDSIIDADMAMLDNHRLHFYRRVEAPNTTDTAHTSAEETETQDSEPPSTEQIREMDSIVNAMEADVTSQCDVCTRTPESNAEPNNPSMPTTRKPEEIKPTIPSEAEVLSDNVNIENTAEGATSQENGEEKNILIKIKYLNDTCKEVEGNLDELLRDFKWRHFSMELSLLRRVRLIFNGRALDEEARTLRACGLHHRAVVHAIVHPPRQHRSIPEVENPANVQTHETLNENTQVPERTWDLENILMTLVSVALTVVWFFRCEYSNMFTASASVALFGLTVFYSVAIFGLYLSDTFHFERRPERPLPTE